MAEEDEVDILGDCSLDSFLTKNENLFDSSTSTDLLKCDDSILVSQNSDFLKCDYTIHPQWLLDKPSANPACWYNTSISEFVSDITQSEIPQISTENSITDESGWTEKEKNLLGRGIEIFGKSNARLSQFIGSKTPSEVKYYLKNFYSDSKSRNNYGDVLNDFIQETVISSQDSASVSDKEILDDAEIPASIEEVIAAVSTAKPTVRVTNKDKSKSIRSSINYNNIRSGQSLLKRNYLKDGRTSHIQIHKHKNVENRLEDKKSVLKYKKVKFKSKNNVIKVKKDKSVSYKPKIKPCKSHSAVNRNFSGSDIEIVTGKGLSVPVCSGEEVIKIKKGDDVSGSEEEIDIVDSDTEIKEKSGNSKKIIKIEGTVTDIGKIQTTEDETVLFDNENKTIFEYPKKILDLSELCEDDINFLNSTNLPKVEYNIDQEKITDLEKFIHYEFFEGRPTKTPVRYLKIRNHILSVWKNIKPAYVTKTSIRQGLKQCGDVNCIGRIHQFLEQIGAINFGCAQTSYIRPLYEFVLSSNNSVKEKIKENDDSSSTYKYDTYGRNRNKKKYVHDGEGGCTLQHNESGDIINTTVVNEDPVIKKTYIKKPTVRLIYCKAFNDQHMQEFVVEISLTVILLMDFHAHTSLSEVMGLVGGYWNDKNKILTITRYEPCKNIASSSTHCDMCPVTQAKAADILHNENLAILGWFHSHPTFAPEPSQQDIDTQLSVQQWIGYGKPCIGIILTPFSSHGALIASPYRCMIVQNNSEDQYVPFKLKVDVTSHNICIEDLLIYAKKIYNWSYDKSNSRINFSKTYFQNTSITYLEKFISSIKMHLAKCSNISKMNCDAIIQGFGNICSGE